MDVYRFDLKLYFKSPAQLPREAAITAFHRFVQTGVVGELIIDVADYGHVPSGPGVMLIGLEAHYALDASDGRLGLLYSRKRPFAGSFEEGFRHGVRRLLHFASILENEKDLGIKVDADRLALRFNDRLRAPNSQETLDVVVPVVDRVLQEIYQDTERNNRWEGPGRARFGLQVEIPDLDQGLGVDRLLERLETPALAVAS